MNRKLLKAMALASLLAAPAAFATPITFDVTGTVDALPIAPIAGVSVGSLITAAITIDTANLYGNYTGGGETYLQQIGGADFGMAATPQLINAVVTVGGTTYTDPLAGRNLYSNEVIISPSASPSYQLAEYSSDFSTVQFDFTMNLNGAGMYSATGAPPTSLSAGDTGSGTLTFGAYDGSGPNLDFLVDSISVPGASGGSAVPEPFIAGLLGFGLIGLAVGRRKTTLAVA